MNGAKKGYFPEPPKFLDSAVIPHCGDVESEEDEVSIAREMIEFVVAQYPKLGTPRVDVF